MLSHKTGGLLMRADEVATPSLSQLCTIYSGPPPRTNRARCMTSTPRRTAGALTEGSQNKDRQSLEIRQAALNSQPRM